MSFREMVVGLGSWSAGVAMLASWWMVAAWSALVLSLLALVITVVATAWLVVAGPLSLPIWLEAWAHKRWPPTVVVQRAQLAMAAREALRIARDSSESNATRLSSVRLALERGLGVMSSPSAPSPGQPLAPPRPSSVAAHEPVTEEQAHG